MNSPKPIPMIIEGVGLAGLIISPVLGNKTILTIFLSVALLGLCLGIFTGCASQPPPSPPIVQAPPPPKPVIVIPPDPMANLLPDVQTAIKDKQTPTLNEGITTFIPYTPNQEWTLYCAPLSATEIRLNPDETTDKDSVVIADSLRWAIKISRQTVMVEPLGTTRDPHMQTNLIIATNRRSYHFLLKLRSTPMTAVQFYYPDDIRQLQAEREAKQAEAAKQGPTS